LSADDYELDYYYNNEEDEIENKDYVTHKN
jgi:hypothetical protein